MKDEALLRLEKEQELLRWEEYRREHQARWASCEGKSSKELEASLAERKIAYHGIPTSDFSAAAYLCDYLGQYNYTSYLLAFSLKNPIMYVLFYRWWFILSAPRGLRKHLPRMIRLRFSGLSLYPELGGPAWAIFAMHHPVLFFFWLVTFGSLKLFVNLLTAIIRAR